MLLLLIYDAVNAHCPSLKPDIPIRDGSKAIVGAVRHFVHGHVAPNHRSVHYSYVH